MAGTHDSGIDGRAIAKRAAFFVAVAVIAGVGLAALPGIDEVRSELSSADPEVARRRGGAAGCCRCSGSCARCGRRSIA